MTHLLTLLTFLKERLYTGYRFSILSFPSISLIHSIYLNLHRHLHKLEQKRQKRQLLEQENLFLAELSQIEKTTLIASKATFWGRVYLLRSLSNPKNFKQCLLPWPNSPFAWSILDENPSSHLSTAPTLLTLREYVCRYLSSPNELDALSQDLIERVYADLIPLPPETSPTNEAIISRLSTTPFSNEPIFSGPFFPDTVLIDPNTKKIQLAPLPNLPASDKKNQEIDSPYFEKKNLLLSYRFYSLFTSLPHIDYLLPFLPNQRLKRHSNIEKNSYSTATLLLWLYNHGHLPRIQSLEKVPPHLHEWITSSREKPSDKNSFDSNEADFKKYNPNSLEGADNAFIESAQRIISLISAVSPKSSFDPIQEETSSQETVSPSSNNYDSLLTHCQHLHETSAWDQLLLISSKALFELDDSNLPKEEKATLLAYLALAHDFKGNRKQALKYYLQSKNSHERSALLYWNQRAR